jgi:hypothetical protein
MAIEARAWVRALGVHFKQRLHDVAARTGARGDGE